MKLDRVEEAIEDIRLGRMVIVADDEDRENEGDLIIPAQMATPAAINFMATHGRGLICLSLDRKRVEALGLQPMSRDNRESMQTAFTTSIEAKEGVTTGISAADRARTVTVAIDPSKGPEEIVTPGHVFPLIAKDGGDAGVDEMVDLIHKYVYTDRPREKAAPSIINGSMRLNKDAAINIASVADQLAWMQAEGLVNSEITLETFLDTSYVETIGT